MANTLKYIQLADGTVLNIDGTSSTTDLNIYTGSTLSTIAETTATTETYVFGSIDAFTSGLIFTTVPYCGTYVTNLQDITGSGSLTSTYYVNYSELTEYTVTHNYYTVTVVYTFVENSSYIEVTSSNDLGYKEIISYSEDTSSANYSSYISTPTYRKCTVNYVFCYNND